MDVLTIKQNPRFNEFFHAITHQHQIWWPDRFDVASIHQEARQTYWRLLHRIDAPQPADSGRILLLLGDSGSGKTHLMRVLRNSTHEAARGYFSYMQMTSSVTNYARYVLNQTIDSLDKQHYAPLGGITSLLRLSNALAEKKDALTPTVLKLLRGGELAPRDRCDLIAKAADRILHSERFRQVDVDLVRALLFLQAENPTINTKVFKFLRCEPLALYDQEVLGGLLAPRTQEDDPQRMLIAFAHLIQALDAGALVICFDQLEDILQMDDGQRKFQHAIQTAIALAEMPNVVIVIACLSDYYLPGRSHLFLSHIDRIEKDPEPVKLIAGRSAEEIRALIAIRLEAFCEEEEIPYNEQQPLSPFPSDLAETLAGMPTRQVLEYFHSEHGSIEPSMSFSQRWNDHLVNMHRVPETDESLLALLAESIDHCQHELKSGHRFEIAKQGNTLAITIKDAAGATVQSLLAALCQKSAAGGALKKQIDALVHSATSAGGRIPTAVRSTDFPSNPNTQIAQRLGQFVAEGGRRVTVFDSDWRAMIAMRSFQAQHGSDPSFAEWLRADRPLTRLPSLQQLLDLASLKAAKTANPNDEKPNPEKETQITVKELPVGILRLGQTRDYQSQPVGLEPSRLNTHAAFLGGSGSGKTTLALTLIEQLLLRDIPVLLLDRKGDLCSYANPRAWEKPLTDPAREQMRIALRDKIEVALYTPGSGEERGRPLSISIVPPGLGELQDSSERQQIAQFAAMSLGAMMGYKAQGLDLQRIAILKSAIEVLAELYPQASPSIEQLMDFIDSGDPLLINAIGKLETKHFKKLVGDLQTQSIINASLFRGGKEALDVGALLGKTAGAKPARTRLSIISTAFLGSNDRVLFWVAQLLMEMGRYISRHPSDALQAVVLFDEADLYLPAQSKPATKEPFENLLKRARSAGVGLFLATQSPGDLDYMLRDQISTWFIGKIKEQTALNKLKPMLSEAKIDVSSKLPNQEAGEFYSISHGEVTSLKADLSLIRAEQVPTEEILALAEQTFLSV